MSEHAERSAVLTSLYARLALGLVALVTLLGAVNLAIMLHAGRLYQQELNQQLNRTLAAKGKYFPLLEDPQQLHLNLRGDITDLVQEECPLVRLFE